MTLLALFSTILGLSVWMGSVVFATFFVFPMLSRRLTPGKAAELTDLISSRYYYLGLVCGGLMEVGGTAALFNEAIRIPTLTYMGLTGAALVSFLYCGIVLLPRTVDLRRRLQSTAGMEENFSVRERYDQIIRLSVFLNWLVLFLLVSAAMALAALAAPNPA